MSETTYKVEGESIEWDHLPEAKIHGYLLRAKAMVEKVSPGDVLTFGVPHDVQVMALLARMIQVEEQRGPLSGIFGGNS